MSSRPLAIVDIDGVVADVRHRLVHVERYPKDWDAFFAAAVDDPPHPEGVELVQQLARDHEVVYLTGRPDHMRGDTSDWLDQHGIGGHRLVMRPPGNRRPAARMKVELLGRLADGREVGVVVDDDDLVLAALEDAGYPTFRADWERRSPQADQTLLTAQEVEGET